MNKFIIFVVTLFFTGVAIADEFAEFSVRLSGNSYKEFIQPKMKNFEAGANYSMSTDSTKTTGLTKEWNTPSFLADKNLAEFRRISIGLNYGYSKEGKHNFSFLQKAEPNKNYLTATVTATGKMKLVYRINF